MMILICGCVRAFVRQHVKPTPRTFDGGLYTGYVGIALAALHVLRRHPTLAAELSSGCEALVHSALGQLKANTRGPRRLEDRLSVLLGEAGVWMTAAMHSHVSAPAPCTADFVVVRLIGTSLILVGLYYLRVWFVRTDFLSCLQ